MSEYLLREALELLRELEFMNGPGMQDRPDTSGLRLRGNATNFDTAERGDEFPYDDDNAMNYGVPDGPRGLDRGTRPGTDVHGGPPEPRLQHTWEGADWEEAQRHGDDKYRNVWTQTPEGEEMARERQDEAMGTPIQTGPVAPMDGLSNQSLGRGYRSGSEEDGLPGNGDMNTGPGNMWGGPGTIPGAAGGWASSPAFGDHPGNVWNVPEDDKEQNEMNLREFFDASPVPVAEVENPEPEHLGDQTDDEIEDDLPDDGPELSMDLMGEPDGDEDDGEPEGDHPEPDGDEPDFGDAGEPGSDEPDEFQISVGSMPKLLPRDMTSVSDLSQPPLGGAVPGGRDLVGKSSAWDVLQRVVDAMAPCDDGGPGPGTGIPGGM